MAPFGIKDALDIIIVAMLLYYLYKIMKESGTINIFFGVLAFIIVWVVASEIFEMRLIGTILDKVMSIGLIILVILFQDQIKRFLVELGNHNRWRFCATYFAITVGRQCLLRIRAVGLFLLFMHACPCPSQRPVL